jgi:hypothetical protein
MEPSPLGAWMTDDFTLTYQITRTEFRLEEALFHIIHSLIVLSNQPFFDQELSIQKDPEETANYMKFRKERKRRTQSEIKFQI